MPEEEARTDGGVAVAEPLAEPASDAETSKPTKKDGDDFEYDVEFATPFGNLEFEFEPVEKRDRKARERKAKAERDAAIKAAKAAAARTDGGRGILGKLVIVVVVLAVVGAAIAIAYWLFARPGDDEDDAVPPEFAQELQPQGFLHRIRRRLREAVRAGRKASRETQLEQRERFEQLSGGG